MFVKQAQKIDHTALFRIREYLYDLQALDNPRSRGKALTRDRKGLWRYRIGDYRVIVEIRDAELVVIALEVGHRKNVYE